MTQKKSESMNNENLIFDINENNFTNMVIENSKDKIILVDFWAPWCGPCKKLTPLLESIIYEGNGIVSLAKLNVDENKHLATQLKIQSIPTVIAFYKNQIVNAFQGVLPKKQIIEFIEKISGKSFPKNKEEFYNKIKELIKKNNLDEARSNIEDFLAENSNDIRAVALYIECMSNLGKFKDTKDFIDSLSADLIADQNIQKEINKLNTLDAASKNPSIKVLFSNYNKNPENIENLRKLCDKYFFEKQYEEAFELLLENYSKLKDKKKDSVKKILLKYFDMLGSDHEKTIFYRRKLSSLLFI